MNRTRLAASLVALAAMLPFPAVAQAPAPATPAPDALADLKARFNATSESVRVMTLLAPT